MKLTREAIKMGKNKKNRSTVYEIGKIIDENVKYVLPIDEFDINVLQLSHSKFKLRNNENVVPVWSLQQSKLYSDYYEFEIIGTSSENSESKGTTNPVNDMTTVASTSTDNNNKMNIITKLNETSELIDFTTYIKLVNVFNKSDAVVAEIASEQDSLEDAEDEGQSFEGHKPTATNKYDNTDQIVTVHVLSGEKLNVSMSNFHGIWKSRDCVQCKLCMVMVEDEEAHKMEIRHMKRIASPIDNKHCIRKIGPIWNHCVLCNEIIENTEFHVKASTTHTKHLEKASKHSAKRQPNSNCTTSVDNTVNTVKNSLFSCPKITNTNVNQPTKNSSQNVDKSVIQRLGSLINKTDSTTTTVATAKNSAVIVNNDTGLFTSNGNESFCNVCNRKMFSIQLKSHMEGKSHKAQLLKIKNEDLKEVAINCKAIGSGEKNSKSNKYKPKENSIPLNTVTPNLKINKNEKGRNDNADGSNKNILTFNTRVLISEECEDVAFCHVCNRKMQSDQLRAHIKGKSHKAQLLKSKNEGVKDVQRNCYLPSGSGVQTTKPNEYQLKQNYVPDKTGIQNFKIQKDKGQMKVETNATVNTRLEFANDKSLFKSNECENVAFCNVCNRKMHSNQLEAHINGKTHKAQLQIVNTKKDGIKEIAINSDLLSVSGVKNTSNEYRSEQNSLLLCNKTDISNSKIIKEKEVKNIEAKRSVVDNKQSVLTSNEYESFACCKVCNIKLHINSLKSHVDGEHHKAMLDNKAKSKDIAENTTVKLDSEWRVSENFDEIFQKNLRRKLFNCNGDKYGEVISNALLDTCSELRPSTCSARYTNQPMYNDKVREEAVRSSPVNDKPKNICNTTKIENFNYLMTNFSRFVTCKVCHETFFNAVVYLLNHVEGEKHKKKYTNLLEKNVIKMEKENLLYCEVCKVFMCVGTELVHIETDHHKRLIVTKLKSSEITNKRIIYCDFCDKVIYLCIDMLYYYEMCCSAAIFYKNSIVIVDVDRLYCCYCSKYFNEHEVLSHILTPEHLSTAQVYHTTSYRICSQIKHNLCQVCNETVIGSKTVYNIILHLDSDQHRSKYNKLLNDNNIEKQGDSLYCKPCKENIKLQNEIFHIDQMYHREMLEKPPIQFVFLMCIIFASSVYLFFNWKK